MKKEKYIIEIVVGYMLKVMKSGVGITDFKDEFSCIRHGDYDKFIEKVNGGIPFMVTYGGDCDFFKLVKSAPSLKKFYLECKNKYGIIKGEKIPDIIFEKLALFEILLRMRANNHQVGAHDFKDVINNVGIVENMSFEEINKLHVARKFLNVIKHTEKIGSRFGTWNKGVIKFLECEEVLEKYNLNL